MPSIGAGAGGKRPRRRTTLCDGDARRHRCSGERKAVRPATRHPSGSRATDFVRCIPVPSGTTHGARVIAVFTRPEQALDTAPALSTGLSVPLAILVIAGDVEALATRGHGTRDLSERNALDIEIGTLTIASQGRRKETVDRARAATFIVLDSEFDDSVVAAPAERHSLLLLRD